MDYLKNFHVKRTLYSVIDCLIAQELPINQIEEEVKKIAKSILPNADKTLILAISNYAKSRCRLNKHEKVLYVAINNYQKEVIHE